MSLFIFLKKGNAVKFTKKGGVLISVSKTPNILNLDLMEITVKDTGSGIKKTNMKSLGKISYENEKKLVGIGLTISNYIAKQLASPLLSGIFFESKEGEGSTFTFHIENLKCELNEELEMEQIPIKKLEKINVSILDSKYSSYNNDSEISLTKTYDDFEDNHYLSDQASKYLSVGDFKNKFSEIKEGKSIKDSLSFTHFNSNEQEVNTKSYSSREFSRDFSSASNKKFSILLSKVQDEIKTDNNSTLTTNFKSLASRLQYSKTFTSQKSNNLDTNTVNSLTKKSKIVEKFKQKLAKKACNCPDVLIVDDNPLNILALETLLQSFGLNTEKALSGDEAIEKIKGFYEKSCCSKEFQCFAYKCIFMDIDMPEKDGFQTSEEINEYFKEKNFQQLIIPCTAFTDEKCVNRCKEIGLQDFLSKPVTCEILEHILYKYIYNLFD